MKIIILFTIISFIFSYSNTFAFDENTSSTDSDKRIEIKYNDGVIAVANINNTSLKDVIEYIANNINIKICSINKELLEKNINISIYNIEIEKFLKILLGGNVIFTFNKTPNQNKFILTEVLAGGESMTKDGSFQDDTLQDANDIAKFGREKYEEGNIDLARELLEDALSTDPSNLEALLTLGAIYYDTDKKEDFETLCYNVITFQIDNVELYQSLEHFFIEKSDVTLAEQIIKDGFDHNPSNPDFIQLYEDLLAMKNPDL